jgi:hypothetical protein
LEQQDRGEPPYDSYLVQTVHRLHRKPLNEFTIEDLRIMIGQGVGLPYLIPMAVERLEADPLAAGDFYPGALLSAVLRTDVIFWQNHPDSHQRARRILARVRDALLSLDEVDRGTIEEMLQRLDAPWSEK